MGREHCNNLCKKPTTGRCDLCDALDASDAFWRLLIGGFLVVGWRGLLSFVKSAMSLLTQFVAGHPVWLAFIVFVIALLAVSIISYIIKPEDLISGVIIEAFGMVFDLLVISWFMFWLNQVGEKRREIERYQHEINDLLIRDSSEGNHQIVYNIKCLNDREVSSIYLSGANLSYANLRGANLSGANLSGANLRGAYLIGAHLIGAHLIGADLIGAHLIGAHLIGADLIGAHLSEAHLSQADLIGADLSQADLIGADLSGANLSGAILSDIKWDNDTRWPDGFNPPPSR